MLRKISKWCERIYRRCFKMKLNQLMAAVAVVGVCGCQYAHVEHQKKEVVHSMSMRSI